jgi:outer membrane immunogenic protein
MKHERRLTKVGAMVFVLSGAATPAAAADLGGAPRTRGSVPAQIDNTATAIGSSYEARAPIWTGAYLGLGLGVNGAGGRLKSSATDVKTDLKQDGNAIGASIYGGYNWQAGRWVYGLEAEIGGAGGKVKSTDTALGTVSGTAQTFGSLRLRGGYTFGSWLLYGTAGVAAGESKITAPGVAESKAGHVGVVLGLGAEYALSDRWRLRGEALTYSAGERDVALASGTQKAAIGLSTLRFGAAYKF